MQEGDSCGKRSLARKSLAVLRIYAEIVRLYVVVYLFCPSLFFKYARNASGYRVKFPGVKGLGEAPVSGDRRTQKNWLHRFYSKTNGE
ncbi:hypothetical protein HP456_07520 [Bacillus haikouensis]|uniref:hypothetical protein n=1 Tax=Bacillus haikouensis TaxID=1510468 RepID=UPI001557F84C|nr:hypothetical protein [Bacillus haikouensis]NQD65768.1 hypothetical protein [Bacillus haikouensis]